MVRYLRVVLRHSWVFEKGQEFAMDWAAVGPGVVGRGKEFAVTRAAGGPGVVVWMLEQG